MNAPAAPVTVDLPHNLSYSQKSTLSDCGGRYYLERGQRVPQRPGWANVGGTAAHSTTEELDRRLYEAGEHIDSYDDIVGIFESYFRQETEKTERMSGFSRDEFRASGRASKEFPDKETDQWWLRKGPEMCRSWVGWRDASPFQIATVTHEVEREEVTELAIEVIFESEFGGATVRGAVDRLMVQEVPDAPPMYLVLDLKFGSREPSGPDQLLTYRAGVLDTFGIDPEWGTYWMGRKGANTTPANLHALPLEAVAYDYRMAQEQRLRGDFRYHPTSICVACSVNQYCPVFGGQYANTIPQPWELTAPPTLREPSTRVS